MKTFKKINLSLKNKLLISFLAVLLIPSIIIGFNSYQSAENTINHIVMDSAEESTQLINQAISQFVDSQIQNIDYLSDTLQPDHIKDNQDEHTRVILDKIQASKPDVEQTYIGTETGEFMNSPTSFQNPPGYDPRERPWYQEAMKQKGKAIITDPYISKSSKQVVVTIAKATADGKGVVAVNLKLDSLTETINEMKIGKKGYVFLVDSNNHFISHPTEEAGAEAEDAYFTKIQASETGKFDYTIKGNQSKLAFLTNELTGWKIVGTFSQEEVDQSVQPILNKMLIVIGISLALGLLLILFMIRSIIKPISSLIGSAKKISNGDLSETATLTSNDEIGTLAASFDHMRDSLRKVLLSVNDKATSLAASSEQLTASTEQNSNAAKQISDSIQEVAFGSERQSQSLEESTQMVGEISTAMKHISDSSNEASLTAANASDVVQEGNKAIETSVNQMNYIKTTVSELSNSISDLGDHSMQIGQIIDVISGIAEQTNLLALNAAIEAARAGENGKGFAVVADEVRKLAEQSSQATEQIRQVILTIQNETNKAVQSMQSGSIEVDKGIEVVNHAGNSFARMKQFVENVSTQFQEVSASVQKISVGTEQMVGHFNEIMQVSEETAAGVQNVSASTQEQLASMEDISSSAASLTKMADELQEMVRTFKM